MSNPKTKRQSATAETAEAKCHLDQRLVSRQTLMHTLLYLQSYKGNPYVALSCMCLAHGFPELVGVDNQPELARRLGVSKAAVNKCLMQIQSMIPELEKLPDQRTPEMRANMMKSRTSQLSANHG